MNQQTTRKSLWPALEQQRNRSQAVQHGGAIHVSATFALDANGRLVSDVNMPMQIRHAYRNLEETLRLFGASLADVLSETVYVTSLDQALITDQLARIYPAGAAPARTLVEVSRLAVPNAMIAVSCIAAARA